MINFVICEVDQAKWVSCGRHAIDIENQCWTTENMYDEIVIPPVVINLGNQRANKVMG